MSKRKTKRSTKKKLTSKQQAWKLFKKREAKKLKQGYTYKKGREPQYEKLTEKEIRSLKYGRLESAFEYKATETTSTEVKEKVYTLREFHKLIREGKRQRLADERLRQQDERLREIQEELDRFDYQFNYELELGYGSIPQESTTTITIDDIFNTVEELIMNIPITVDLLRVKGDWKTLGAYNTSDLQQELLGVLYDNMNDEEFKEAYAQHLRSNQSKLVEALQPDYYPSDQTVDDFQYKIREALSVLAFGDVSFDTLARVDETIIFSM